MTRRRRQLLNTAEDLSQPRDIGNVTHFEPRRETVGDLLRRAREGRGQDVEAVAAKLRIRPGYLKAIEAGRFQDLPGSTYAVGFVRTYADHLGLDAEDVVRRFRDEVAELKGQTQLIFPVGVAAEGKMPRGAILLLSAVLAAIAYGGWYYLSEREQSAVDLIPELPAKLRALVTGEEPTAAETVAGMEPGPDATTPESAPVAPPAASVAPEPAPTGVSASDPAEPPAPAAEAAQSNPVPVPETTGDPVAESAAAASALPGPVPTSPTAEEDVAASAALMSEDSTDAQTASPPAIPPAPDLVGSGVQTPDSTVLGSAAAPPPAAPSLDSAGLPTVAAPTPAPPSTGPLAAAAPSGQPAGLAPIGDGQAFGAVDGPSRIVVVARLESWVQVTDPGTNALLTRVLRAGDRYYVPDEPGLNLATGNAGGIDIWVDGRKVPALGPVGVVRRGVALDPQRLMAGTALAE